MKKEYIDGFLLGDGGVGIDRRMKSKKARYRCSLEYREFCKYLIGFFKGTVSKYNSIKMKQGFFFEGSTLYSEEAYKQYIRWYPKNKTGKRLKQIPNDVEITPISVMMWYLGDGSLVKPEDNSTVMLRLSTDGFLKEGVLLLAKKLNDIGIKCHRNNDNRIMVDARGIPAFFNYIGRTSPVKCYDYKFDLPEWRFESKRMKEVAEELSVSYNRLSHLVKIKKINSFRLSEKGRPRFLPIHIEEAKKLIKVGELY